jgi:hypothetical protein
MEYFNGRYFEFGQFGVIDARYTKFGGEPGQFLLLNLKIMHRSLDLSDRSKTDNR